MSEIPRYEDMYAGTYFSPDDFVNGDNAVVTITAHEAGELTVRGKGKNWRMVLTVAENIKKVAVNKTSWKRLTLAWGKDFDAWIGNTIRVERGEVNGKAAVLCTALARKAAPPAKSPEQVAWATVLSACGNDRDQATLLWTKLKREHGGNFEAIAAACGAPPNVA